MIKPRRYFPWRLARQVFFSHFLFVVVTLVLTGFSLRYFLYTELLRSNDVHRTLGRFDSYLTSLFLTVLFFAAIYLALTSRAYARPLGRMIQRARELRRLNAEIPSDELDPEELQEEPGEWTDLERALNRIHRDLRSRTDDLSREREELSALIGAVSDAILAVGVDENPLFFNPQFALLFGGKERDGRRPSLSEMFRSPDVLSAFREVLKSGERQTVNASLHTKASSNISREFSIAIAPLRDNESGDIFGVVGIFHDVTELKQSEQIRIEFVGNASHELRTPITNIKGYVETLKDDFKNNRYDGAQPFIEIISKNVDRLIFLVNDLLDLSTLEQGGELAKSAVSVRDVSETALRSLETKRAAKKQTIRVNDGASQLLADPRRLEQVVTNLIDNAVKYSPEGSTIDVNWEHDGDAVVLRVKDNGAGIPPEHHARLFERFYRVDAGRSREQGGTGLGLAIVKHIMLKHGGTIRVLSKPGQGSEFICTFPHAAL
jgi:two-component system, OmpR family, phosphate regulon sensor histidine kinase PhoR